jgi:hypothetical protein
MIIILYVDSVITTTRDSSVGRAVDCRVTLTSIGHWFDSGLRDIFGVRVCKNLFFITLSFLGFLLYFTFLAIWLRVKLSRLCFLKNVLQLTCTVESDGLDVSW